MFQMLSMDAIASLDGDSRRDYLVQLKDYDMEYGTSHFSEWQKWQTRCLIPGCARQAWGDGGTRCLSHARLEDINVDEAIRIKTQVARMRLLDMLDDTLDRLEEILQPDADVRVVDRLKAIDTVLDRSGVPRQTASSVLVDASVAVSGDSSVSDEIEARLARLAGSLAVPVIHGELEPAPEAN